VKDTLLYKNYFIGCESFQREKHGSWVPQYTITRQATESNDFPSHQYQSSHALPTKDEADCFAVQKHRSGSTGTKSPDEFYVVDTLGAARSLSSSTAAMLFMFSQCENVEDCTVE
jgi:hypothetical protein